RHGEHELGYLGVELHAVLRDYLVAAAHGADRGGDGGAAGVLEAFVGTEQWLLADHAGAAHLLNLVIGVGNDPMTAQQLRRHRAGVGDGNGIGKHVAAAFRVGLVRDENGAGRDGDVVFFVRHVVDS